MSKSKIILGVLIIFFVVFISEALYAYRNNWVRYSYALSAAKFFNNNVNCTGCSLFIITQGKIKFPDDNKFKEDVRQRFLLLPQEYNLPAAIYELALVAYENDYKDITKQLLELTISLDPDFSFWRVELANFYLKDGNTILASETLNDCLLLDAPRDHCRDYMDNILASNRPQSVGYLNETIRQLYVEKEIR